MPYIRSEDQKRAAKAHYEANKETYKARSAAHRKKTRRIIRDLVLAAKDRPCADCNMVYPYYVMQFDHASGEKNFTIGTWSQQSIAPARIIAEIELCEVVCANCHAERTHQRGQAYAVRVVTPPKADSCDITLF